MDPGVEQTHSLSLERYTLHSIIGEICGVQYVCMSSLVTCSISCCMACAQALNHDRRHALAHERDDLAVALEIRVGVIAADEEGADADVVVVEKCLRHRLRRADERGAVAGRTGRLRDRREERSVVPVALLGRSEEALAPGAVLLRGFARSRTSPMRFMPRAARWCCAAPCRNQRG